MTSEAIWPVQTCRDIWTAEARGHTLVLVQLEILVSQTLQRLQALLLDFFAFHRRQGVHNPLCEHASEQVFKVGGTKEAPTLSV